MPPGWLVLVRLVLVSPLLWATVLPQPQPQGRHTWTPIHQGQAQVDLWTVSTSGCSCSWNNRSECACCVRDGGCHCGRAAPQRCAQCGLQQYCASMCNATIDSARVSEHSGRSYGMIKSAAISGPGLCSFTLRPDARQRVEIQLYRIIHVGRYHNNSCRGGSLQLTDGPRAARGISLCGSNERFTTPVVMFADRGPATLTLRVTEPSERSQFLAYYSFTPANASGAGFVPRGGKRREHTDCDWLYQDFLCGDGCVLASPGYPGLYPGDVHCGYLVTASSVRARITLELLALSLPLAHCATDNLTIYHGSGPTGLRVHTICDMTKTTFDLPGPNIYIQFNAGPSKPPYNYNGFLARLDFPVPRAAEGERVREHSGEPRQAPSTAPPTPAPTVLMDRPGPAPSGCSVFFSGAALRSGVLDSRHHPGCLNLSVAFRGRPSDLVKMSIFNYRLKAPACGSMLDVFLGPDHSRPDKRLCSPMTKYAHGPTGRFQSQQIMMSQGPDLALNVVLTADQQQEFVDGAWLFHDQSTQGIPEPDSLCSASFEGPPLPPESESEPEQRGAEDRDGQPTDPTQSTALQEEQWRPRGPGWTGTFTSPGNQHLFWNVQGHLRCVQSFRPRPGQSVALALVSLGLRPDPGCWSQCDSLGCLCRATAPLDSVDHVRLLDSLGAQLACLCGDPQKMQLPLSLRSWTPLSLEYNVAHFTWALKGFGLQADYAFRRDPACGRREVLAHSGAIASGHVEPEHQGGGTHHLHMDCQWLLLSNIQRELDIQIATPQSQHCASWNITIHRYTEKEDLTRPIATFCPRDTSRTFNLPWKQNSVIIRLLALSLNVPEFTVRWQSKAVQSSLQNKEVLSTGAGVLGEPVGGARGAGGVLEAPPLLLCVAQLLLLALLRALAGRSGGVDFSWTGSAHPAPPSPPSTPRSAPTRCRWASKAIGII